MRYHLKFDCEEDSKKDHSILENQLLQLVITDLVNSACVNNNEAAYRLKQLPPTSKTKTLLPRYSLTSKCIR